MDTARGIAILLVIIFHAVTEVDKQFGLPDTVVAINNIVAPARMPLMVFLSGLLLGHGLAKPWNRYFAGKLSKILWPYIVWSGIMLLLVSVVAAEHPRAGEIARLLAISPIDHLWFLRDLFVFYIVMFCLRRCTKTLHIVLASAVLLAGQWAGFEQLERFAYLYFFFTLGWLYSGKIEELKMFIEKRAVTFVSLVFAALLVPSVLVFGDIRYDVLFLPAVASLASIVLRVSVFLEGRLSAVRAIGRNSIVYYLVHWPVVLVLAHVCVAFGSDIHPFMITILCIGTALASSYVCERLNERGLPFSLFFGISFSRAYRQRLPA
ncbi:acyltransferase [Arthrobacter sp. Sa2CUA1]|uniref:Acyltransferase n=1 Tax=Arthrobacter gallicola TaxID=2762225 RepID=A0ABR8UUZ9_9MICC|nr:acyltransferase [Arthrobacter gallicola]MBD7996066.1 acyltransferase [Arthrobacter gallicola]